MPIQLNERQRELLVFALFCTAILYFGSATEARRHAQQLNDKARIKAASALTTGSIIAFRKGSGKPPGFIGHYTFGVMGRLYDGEKTDQRMKGSTTETNPFYTPPPL